MRFACVFLMVCYSALLFGQKKNGEVDMSAGDYVITNPKYDSIKERDRSSSVLRNLKDGSIVVRLKKSQKSVDAYRKAGRDDVADRMEKEHRKMNENIHDAFKNFFTFCKVYFIYADETDTFLKGSKPVLLNDKLEHDPAITFKDSFFIFCEYGSSVPYSDFKETRSQTVYDRSSLLTHSTPLPDTIAVRTTTDALSQTGLVLLDKDLRQLQRPFPYVEGVYLNNFAPAVRTLDRELQRAYYRLVINRDIKEKIKKERKKQQQLLKQMK